MPRRVESSEGIALYAERAVGKFCSRLKREIDQHGTMELSGRVGLSRPYLWMVAHRKLGVSLDYAQRIARGLGTTVGKMVGEESSRR